MTLIETGYRIIGYNYGDGVCSTIYECEGTDETGLASSLTTWFVKNNSINRRGRDDIILKDKPYIKASDVGDWRVLGSGK